MLGGQKSTLLLVLSTLYYNM